MKQRDGLARCFYRGTDGMERWVGWGVVSNNIWVLITADRPRRKQRQEHSSHGKITAN
jgi:hypothetical protein